MKKVILSLGLLAGISATAQAQTTFGVKAGVSLTTLTGDDIEDADSKIGFHGGVMANFKFSDLVSLQPEILYSMKGAQSSEDSDVKLKHNYIDVPVMVQVNAGGLFFEGGPQLGILVSAKAGTDDVEIDTKDTFNTVDLGYAVGLGYKLESGPQIGLRYNGGITSIVKEEDGVDATVRNSAFQLYVGYTFGGK